MGPNFLNNVFHLFINTQQHVHESARCLLQKLVDNGLSHQLWIAKMSFFYDYVKIIDSLRDITHLEQYK